MATQKFKVTYKDGRVEIVTADQYRLVGSWFVFETNGQEVHRANQTEVRSVGQVEAAEIPGPMFA